MIQLNDMKYDFYLLIQEECLKNANQFCKDAVLLKGSGSLGHAYSLAVLGFEELSKFWIGMDLFFDVYDEESEEVKEVQKDHVNKQILGWNQVIAFFTLEYLEKTSKKEELSELIHLLSEGQLSLKAYNKKFRLLVESEVKENPDMKPMLDILDIEKTLKTDRCFVEKRRVAGLYVDINFKNRRIVSTPDSFILENTIFIDTLKGLLEFANEFFISIKKNLKRKELQQFVKSVRELSRQLRKKGDEL